MEDWSASLFLFFSSSGLLFSWWFSLWYFSPLSSISWVFCPSSCSPSRLPVRSFDPLCFSRFLRSVRVLFSVFLPLFFCSLPLVFLFVSVLWSPLSMCFRSSLSPPPPVFLFVPPCSFPSVRPCSALWFFLLFFFFLLPSALPSLAFIKLENAWSWATCASGDLHVRPCLRKSRGPKALSLLHPFWHLEIDRVGEG